MKKLSLFILIFSVFILGSCGEQPLYEKVYSFENHIWEQDVKPVYDVEINDETKAYNFTLSLRTTTDFKYSNLWIFMKTESPDGLIAREPIEILITNPDGSWIGNKTGSIVETPLYFKSMILPIKGKYTFTLEQGITESEVREVLDLGFRVEEAK